MVVKVDDVEALQKEIWYFAACDHLLAGANAALITSKHDDFKKEPEKESTKEPVQEPCNEADQEPANRLQKLSSYHIQHG